jgi:dihydrofolate reductase
VRRLTAFENVSLDGYFVDAEGDMSWAHDVPQDAEFDAFVAGNASGDGALLFGRVTYEMMAGYWTTAMAADAAPAVAAGMNRMQKFVVSRSLKAAAWHNTTLIGGDLVPAIRELKRSSGPDLAILGSGSIVAQLADASLIDEVQLVIVPIALGRGRTLFEGVSRPLAFERTGSRAFGNGKVVLSFRPSAQ